MCTYIYRLREGGCRTSKLAFSGSRELVWRDQSPQLLSQKQALPPVFSYLHGLGTECSFPCSDQEDDEGLAPRGDNENALVMNPSGDVLIGLAFTAKKLSRGHPLFRANICTIRTDFTFPEIFTPPPSANVLNTFPENSSVRTAAKQISEFAAMQCSDPTFSRKEFSKRSQALDVTGPSLPKHHKLMNFKAMLKL